MAAHTDGSAATLSLLQRLTACQLAACTVTKCSDQRAVFMADLRDIAIFQLLKAALNKTSIA